LRNVQQLAEENFASVKMQEWVTVCSHVKAVEEEYMSIEHDMDGVIDRIIINVHEDDETYKQMV
jgi:hypothetical protein